MRGNSDIPDHVLWFSQRNEAETDHSHADVQNNNMSVTAGLYNSPINMKFIPDTKLNNFYLFIHSFHFNLRNPPVFIFILTKKLFPWTISFCSDSHGETSWNFKHHLTNQKKKLLHYDFENAHFPNISVKTLYPLVFQVNPFRLSPTNIFN